MECFFGLTLGFVGFCFDMDLNFVEAQLCVGIPGFEFCRGGSGHLDSFRRFVATKFGAQVGHGIHRGITEVRLFGERTVEVVFFVMRRFGTCRLAFSGGFA